MTTTPQRPPGPTVLVFDDDLFVHREFLAPLRARFIYRADADRAVADVEAIAPQVVFMDYYMGTQTSGAVAVRALRQRWSFDALPIIGISSVATANRDMVRAGATEGCVKMAVPLRFRELMELCLDHAE